MDNTVGKKRKLCLKKALICVAIVFTITLLVLGVFAAFTVNWLLKSYGLLTIDEIVYHLKTSISGTSADMIVDYLTGYGIWAFLCVALVCGVFFFIFKKKPKYDTISIFLVAVVGVGCLCYAYQILDSALDVSVYLKQELFTDPSKREDYVADFYVDTSKTNITFPEGKKRNLIYIYLESMENTYADKANGGAFDYNTIPELTALSEENENFSGSDSTLNGGIALPGSNWTAGAMFAQSSGLPLKIPFSIYRYQENFFPTIVTLGDLLEKNGYNQTFLLGSDADFADMSLFFTSHGHFKIRDYQYAIRNGDIPADYYEYWGYEDAKLYEYAKDELLSLAAQEKPFNLTVITADTHNEDGYVCSLCGHEFGDNQYANVMACASRQLNSFVNWLKNQEFYANTTVVITGDHPTMDSDFCNDVPLSYLRTTYTCILNSDAKQENSDRRRTFSTMDLFPTTLAALGCKIEGNQLGLGVNLYSSKETLVEKYGISSMKSMLSKPSTMMNKLSRAELDESVLDVACQKMLVDTSNEDGFIKFTVRRLDRELMKDSIDRLFLCAIYNDPKTGGTIEKTFDCDVVQRDLSNPQKFDGIVVTDIPYDQLQSAQVYVYITVGEFKDYYMRQYSYEAEQERIPR